MRLSSESSVNSTEWLNWRNGVGDIFRDIQEDDLSYDEDCEVFWRDSDDMGDNVYVSNSQDDNCQFPFRGTLVSTITVSIMG